MALQIALCWNSECEEELKKMGFEKQTVYVKQAPAGKNTQEQVEAGNSEFFGMQSAPFQFVTTSYWGASRD